MKISLRVAAPLALAALLTITFGYLLVIAGRSDDEAPSPTVADPQPTPETEPAQFDVPQNSPTEPVRYSEQRLKRYGGRYPRWNITEFPAGWDHDLATDLHTFFESMVLDQTDPKLGIQKIRQDLRDYLASLGPDALPTLGAVLNAEADFVNRRFLLYGIGDIGPESEEATFLLKDFFLGRQEQPEARSEMFHTIDAIARLDNDTSFDLITDFSKRKNLHAFRAKFVEALGTHSRREEAVGTVVEHMRNDTLHNVRNKAAQFLGKTKLDETLDDVYRAVEKEPHWIVKQTMLGTIGKIGNPASIPFLENQARNASEPGVRLSAARALSRIENDYANRVLKDVARAEPDQRMKKKMLAWVREE